MVPDNSAGIPRAPTYSGVRLDYTLPFAYGTFTPCGVTFQSLRLSIIYFFSAGSYNPVTCLATCAVWALSRSLATTGEIVFTFFSYGYLDVSVPRVRLPVTPG